VSLLELRGGADIHRLRAAVDQRDGLGGRDVHALATRHAHLVGEDDAKHQQHSAEQERVAAGVLEYGIHESSVRGRKPAIIPIKACGLAGFLPSPTLGAP
jgi:hypothetical protein